MRPILINHEQLDIAEKIVAGLDEDTVLTHRVVPLLDGGGRPILDPRTGRQTTVTQSWSPGYVAEAFVTVVEGLLLCEAAQLVAPTWEGATVVPAYSSLAPAAAGFLQAAVDDPGADTGALEPGLLEWLDDGHEATCTMFARACNGRYGNVAVRLGPSDFSHLRERVNRFNAETGAPERFDDTGVLTSALIRETCDRLATEHRVSARDRFRNQTAVAMPAVVTLLLERLPAGPDPGAFARHLLELRDELEPLRRRLGELLAIDDDRGRPIADADELVGAIGADAERLGGAGAGVLVQYCVDELSFLVKLIVKQGADPAEVASEVPPELERRLRSSAPLVLSTQRVADVTRLLERKLGLALDAPDG